MTGSVNGKDIVAKQCYQAFELEQLICGFVKSEKASEIFGFPYDRLPLFLQLWLDMFENGYSVVSVRVREVFLNLKDLEQALRYFSFQRNPCPIVVFDNLCERDKVKSAFLAFLNSVSSLELSFTGLTESLTVNFERNLEEYIDGSLGDDKTALDVKSGYAVYQKFSEYYRELLRWFNPLTVFDDTRIREYPPFFQIDRKNPGGYYPWYLNRLNSVQIRMLVELCEEFIAETKGDNASCLQKYGVPLWTIEFVMDVLERADNGYIDFSELMLMSAKKSERRVRKFFKKLLKSPSGFRAKLSLVGEPLYAKT